MRRFVRHLQAGRNGGLRGTLELRRLDESDDTISRRYHFIPEFSGQKDWRLGNPEIRRPFFRLVNASSQCTVFRRSKIGVKPRTHLGVHGSKITTDEYLMTKE